MNESTLDAIFAAQVENVRELERAWKHVNRDINAAYRCNQASAARYETKLLAFVYCALAEAVFSKLIHSPRAFDWGEIKQIQTEAIKRGVREGWRKAVALALRRVDAQRSGHLENVTQVIDRLINQYIFDPSVLRNKIAHGQWKYALNRDNSSVNSDLTTEINNLDVVELYRRKEALMTLKSIVEDLIKSPNRAHQRDYWTYLVGLESKHQEMRSWTVQKKVHQIREKASRRNTASQQVTPAER